MHQKHANVQNKLEDHFDLYYKICGDKNIRKK